MTLASNWNISNVTKTVAANSNRQITINLFDGAESLRAVVGAIELLELIEAAMKNDHRVMAERLIEPMRQAIFSMSQDYENLEQAKERETAQLKKQLSTAEDQIRRCNERIQSLDAQFDALRDENKSLSEDFSAALLRNLNY